MNKSLFVLAQYCLPQKTLSIAIGKIMDCKTRWLKNALIKWFINRYQVDMSQALEENPENFATFNDFFIRHLKPAARPLASSVLTCPADGTISQIGDIQHNQIFQAKGKSFTLESLLADKELSSNFIDGHFTTIYLSPRDYHRVHMPISGRLIKTIYIPGDLFSVNPLTTEQVDGLFARNERLVCIFETAFGKFAVIMVGAMIVASINTVWAGKVTPPHGEQIVITDYHDKHIVLEQGDEVGYFCLGSTVVLLSEQQCAKWLSTLRANQTVNMGQALTH